MRRWFVLFSVFLAACTYNYDELRGHGGGTGGSGGQAGSASGGAGDSASGGAGGNTPLGSGGQGGSSSGGRGGQGGKAGTGGSSGAGGAGGNPAIRGKGGGNSGSNVDASCSVVTDASVDHSTTSCTSTFNFEGSGNLQDATLLAGSQAFTAISQETTPHTYCGTGSLAIAATFSGTTGALTKGEVDIPLGSDGGSVDLSGKTLTVHVAANPAACGEDLRFKIVLGTSTGSPVAISLNAVTSNFTTALASLATVSGASSTNRIALQAFSTSNYTGTIYVDEIDIQASGNSGTGTGGTSGAGGTTGANCVDAIKINGYSAGGQTCATCKENQTDKSAACEAVIDCLDAMYPCGSSNNCALVCVNSAGADSLVVSCVTAVLTAGSCAVP